MRELERNSSPTVAQTVREARAFLAGRRGLGKSIGFVPTMGALHDGHLSLIRAARSENETVVVSVFVNALQFNEPADLERYPRDLAQDTVLAAGAGTDLIFAPSHAELYPEGFATTVTVAGPSSGLCGAARGTKHFEGVATVVAKLLNSVQPDRAYFGQKDAQQVAVIKQLVQDLNIPTEIVACPTVREADGLALSSRNTHLSPDEREQARSISEALFAAAELIGSPGTSVEDVVSRARSVLAEAEITPEYVEVIDALSMQPQSTLDRNSLLAVAAYVGNTRLIDNLALQPRPVEVPA